MAQHQPTTIPSGRSKAQILSAILWPSFIFAGIANSVFFTFLDPLLIAAELGFEEHSVMEMYSIGFFVFWVLTICSSSCTHYLLRPLHNQRQQRRGEAS